MTRAFVRRAADRATAHPRAAAGVLMPMLVTMVGPSDRYLADFLTSAGLARRHAELVRIAARLLVETYAGARKGTPESADALVRAIYAEVVSGFSWGRRQP